MKKVVKNIFSIWPLCDLVCWHGRRSCGKVALTFDDGPNADYTRQVLDILKAENVLATFFLEGRWVEENPHLIGVLIDAGHEIANHGYDHGDAGVLLQMNKGNTALKQVGVSTNLFRPALGKVSFKEVVNVIFKGKKIVLWSFDTHDSMRYEGKWSGGKPDYSNIRAGDIILMHDDNPVCVAELPLIIQQVKRMGYEFVCILDL